MRCLAVQRTARRREELLEVLRCRQLCVLGLALHLQPAALHQLEGFCLASCQLLGREGARVAGGGRVDDHQQPFCTRWRKAVAVAVLRADVHGGRSGQSLAFEDVGELAGTVA